MAVPNPYSYLSQKTLQSIYNPDTTTQALLDKYRPPMTAEETAAIDAEKAAKANQKAYKSATKKNKKANVYQQLMMQQAADFRRAEQMQREALQRIAEGYSGAQAQISRGAGMAKQEIGDMMRANQAQAEQQMMSRGLGNTTVAMNAQRAVNADTAQRIAQVNAALAAQAGDLSVARGTAMAGANQALGSYYTNRDAMRSNLALNIKKMQMEEAAARAARKGMFAQAFGGLVGQGLGALSGGYFGSLGENWAKG